MTEIPYSDPNEPIITNRDEALQKALEWKKVALERAQTANEVKDIILQGLHANYVDPKLANELLTNGSIIDTETGIDFYSNEREKVGKKPYPKGTSINF